MEAGKDGELEYELDIFNDDDGKMVIGLKPLSIEDAYSLIPKSTSSGYPYFMKGWNECESAKEHYINNAYAYWEGKFDLMDEPYILLKRTQNKGNIPKMRPIECPSKTESIVGKCFTHPLLAVFKHIPEFYGFNGGENVWKVLEELEVENYHHWSEMDFSRYDATTVTFLESLIAVGEAIFPRNKAQWRGLVLYAFFGGLLTPEGYIEPTKHGLFSGSSLTSVFGTMTNFMATRYAILRYSKVHKVRIISVGYSKKKKPNIICLCYGDDSAIITDGTVDPNKLPKFIRETGLDINEDKCLFTEGPSAEFSFLGYVYHKSKVIDHGFSWELVPTMPMMRMAPGFIWTEYSLSNDYVEDMIKKAELAEWSEEEVSHLKSEGKQILEIQAFVSKFNQLTNHIGFKAMVELIDRNSSYPLDVGKLIDVDRMSEIARGHRVSRKLGMFKQAAVLYLLKRTYGIDILKEVSENGDEDILDKFQVKLCNCEGVSLVKEYKLDNYPGYLEKENTVPLIYPDSDSPYIEPLDSSTQRKSKVKKDDSDHQYNDESSVDDENLQKGVFPVDTKILNLLQSEHNKIKSALAKRISEIWEGKS
jgi:hypothetical protein